MTGPWQPDQPPPAAVRPDEGLLPPVATSPVPGTPYQLVLVGVPSTASGPAAASLPIGIVSILVSLLAMCLGTVGAEPGWGLVASGAFVILGFLTGLAAVLLGRVGLTAIRLGPGRVTGRGQAIAGIVCGSSGLGLTALAFLFALALRQ